MNTAEICPIWGTKAEIQSRLEKQELVVDSPRTGGKYCITAKAKELLEELDDRKKACLTSWLVKQRLLGIECPKIEDKIISNKEYGQALKYSERMDKLLEHIKRKANQEPGKPVRVITFIGAVDDEPCYQEALAASESTDRSEFINLLHEMHEKKWLKNSTKGDRPFLGNEISNRGLVRITAEGEAHLEKLQEATPNSSQVFVAMWFDESMSEAWERGIKPAIRGSGYKPFRVDEAEDTGRIDDRIIAEIRRSKFIVADFTHGEEGARGGVYYEAGFAHGLDRPVIFTCRKDLINRAHFDTRQYNHIVWETPEDLRTNLANRISAKFGDGPSRTIKKKSGKA